MTTTTSNNGQQQSYPYHQQDEEIGSNQQQRPTMMNTDGTKHTGMSLILMVNNMLQNADEQTKQQYTSGDTRNVTENYGLQSIYSVERQASSIFTQIFLGNAAGEAYRKKNDDIQYVYDHEDDLLLHNGQHMDAPYYKEQIPQMNESIRPPELDPATDPFTPRDGKTLTWQNVNMTLTPSRRARRRGATERKLLTNVHGEVPKTKTTAIMGPSGAGKTSLLNILAGRARSNALLDITSDIRLDNYRVDPTDIEVRQLIAFVAQDDSLTASQTCRESIRFSAKLRLSRSTTDAELDSITNRMLTELGLTSCADTIVGNALIKGISGGERKRTSVGVELVVKPGMVFLDEPTSGLDSFSAVQVCQVLKKVANAGASVLFTIHQPSSEIFVNFDQIILLNKGRVMYQGPTTMVTSYFAEHGYPCPENYNPADWIMYVAQGNPISELDKAGFFQEDTRDIGQPFVAAPGRDPLGRSEHKSTKHINVDDDIDLQSPGFATQLYMLYQRESSKMKRDYYPLIARSVVTAFQAVMIALLFQNTGKSDFSDLQSGNRENHMGVIMMCQVMGMMGTLQPAIIQFPEERPIFVREYSTNHYGVAPYFLSKFVVDIIQTAFMINLTLMISYWSVSFIGSYSTVFIINYLVAMIGGAMGNFVGCASKGNQRVAQQLLPLILIPNMMFSGFFVNPDNIPIYLQWITYIVVLNYGIKLMLWTEFSSCADESIQLTDPELYVSCSSFLLQKEVDEDKINAYWGALIGLFIGFRGLALYLLQSSASEFL